ncbi:DUF2461 family protein [Actinopolymorpha sp. B11F2]|uniref:DUF2461 family protein n=1 Tax=Actinopolymorpha sp. B11F2 TaxID=3160862 RepID=UPI0032E486D5
MSGRFTGWPKEAYDVLLELDGDPPVDVRERCRKDREQLVRQPMIALLHDVADTDPAYDDFSVAGYYSPAYGRWQHQYATVRIAPFVDLGLAFDLDGLGVHGGGRLSPAAQMARYRTAVAAEASGAELADLLRSLREKGFAVAGRVMKRIPRGYAVGHPRADLLRHRSLIAKRPLGGEDWLHTPDAVDRVLAAFAELRPLTSWFANHVAGSR